jgi:DNA-binding CsgD family transcriptional regulator
MGREAELAAIVDAFESRKAVCWVLAGGIGVGKTRLAREALRRVEARGFATLWVVATRASASIPLAAFAHLLPEIEAENTSLLELLGRARKGLIQRGGGRRLLIGIDDAHLLDDASATLVHQLGQTDSFVLATVRTGEAAPDPIVALWKEGLLGRLEVNPLSNVEVFRLIRQVLGGDVDGLTLHALWTATRGNVLVLRELILGGLERGALTDSAGVWTWKGPLVVTDPLSEVIEARLARLRPAERALVEVLAYGEPVGACELEASFASEILEAIELRGMVMVEKEGRRALVRVAHPLYGEVLRARTSGLRKRAIYRTLIASLERTGARRRLDVLRLANWHLEIGESPSAEVLVAGARQALTVFDPVLAERLARDVAEADRDVAAQVVLAESILLQGRAAEAAAVLAVPSDGSHDDRELALIADRRANVLWSGLGRPSEALEVLSAAALRAKDPSIREGLKAMESGVLVYSGQLASGVAKAQEVLQSPDSPPRASVIAAIDCATAAAVAGRTEEAVRARRNWISVARGLVGYIPFAPSVLFAPEALALTLAGRLDEAAIAAQACYGEGVSQASRDGSAVGAVALGQVALYRGAVSTSMRWLREAAALFRGPVGNNFLFWALGLLAHAAALAGELTFADTAMGEALGARTASLGMFDPQLGLARAWLAAAKGQFSAAQARLARVADEAEESGQLAVAVVALHDLARLGSSKIAAPRLASLAALVEGPFAPGSTAHAEALVHGDAAGLDQAGGSFHGMGADLVAAEAAAGASRAHRAAGRKGSALASAAQARLYLEACPGARSPTFPPHEAPQLTPREREVARLAANGNSNTDIADRLVLSVRTVEGHLQRVYAKLGVADRHALRSVAIPGAD